VKFTLLIQLESDLLGFTLAAISELSREVFLPDQSSADTKSMKKRWQELNLWIFVHDCARNFA
jgi:hypothetical protein